jgi:hypothetical protein
LAADWLTVLAYDKQAELYQLWKTNGLTFSASENNRQNILTVGEQQINVHQHK